MNTHRIVSSLSHIRGLALSAALGLAFVASAQALEVTENQRIACTPDAFRLCASSIPNADAVKSCMIANKAKLSAACLNTFPKDVAKR